jgi:hypothetical protein
MVVLAIEALPRALQASNAPLITRNQNNGVQHGWAAYSGLYRHTHVHDDLALWMFGGVVQRHLVGEPLIGLESALRQPITHDSVPSLTNLVRGDFEVPDGELSARDLHGSNLALSTRSRWTSSLGRSPTNVANIR